MQADDFLNGLNDDVKPVKKESMSLTIEHEYLNLPELKVQFSQIQKKLAPYMNVTTQQHTVTSENAGIVLSTLSEGFLEVVKYLSLSNNQLSSLEVEKKRIEAKVAIEDYSVYIKETAQKGTEEFRKSYVNMHPEVVDIRLRCAFAESIKIELDNYKSCLFMSLSSVKAIAFSQRSSDMLSGGFSGVFS